MPQEKKCEIFEEFSSITAENRLFLPIYIQQKVRGLSEKKYTQE